MLLTVVVLLHRRWSAREWSLRDPAEERSKSVTTPAAGGSRSPVRSRAGVQTHRRSGVITDCDGPGRLLLAQPESLEATRVGCGVVPAGAWCLHAPGRWGGGVATKGTAASLVITDGVPRSVWTLLGSGAESHP
jgi:hypothetical protein